MAKQKDTRQRIVDAAMRLFWEKNYEAVGTDSICKEANVRKGSLYHFFKSKNDIALAVIDERWAIFEGQILKTAFAESTPPLQRFDKFSDILGSLMSRIHNESGSFYGCPFGNLASELSTSKGAVKKKLSLIFSKYTQYFEDALNDAKVNGQIKTDTDTKKLAELLFSCLQGTILVAKTKDSPAILKNQFSLMLSPITIANDN